MFFEYALEPAAISSWERARYLLESFAPWKGRFVAKLPKTWAKAVVDGLTCQDVEKKRITARVEQLVKDRAFSWRVVSDYPPAMPWVERALAEHKKAPFRAIITAVDSGRAETLSAETLSDGDEAWRVNTGGLVVREPAAIRDALRNLLAVSRQAMIIDPYFRGDQTAKAEMLGACCEGLLHSARVDVHAQIQEGPDDPTLAWIKQETERRLPRHVPKDISLRISYWRERTGGQRLHNRYLLTEVGGVQFGDGVQSGGAGQEDRLSLIEESTRVKLWEHFNGAVPAFDSAGPSIAIKGSKPR